MVLPVIEHTVEFIDPKPSVIGNCSIEPFCKFVETFARLHVTQFVNNEHGEESSTTLLFLSGYFTQQGVETRIVVLDIDRGDLRSELGISDKAACFRVLNENGADLLFGIVPSTRRETKLVHGDRKFLCRWHNYLV